MLSVVDNSAPNQRLDANQTSTKISGIVGNLRRIAPESKIEKSNPVSAPVKFYAFIQIWPQAEMKYVVFLIPK
jgi:hypothetical protein